MLWGVHKLGKTSYLVGTVHFFPFSFRKTLTGLITEVDRVFLEGPLDESSRQQVVAKGSRGDSSALLRALDPDTIRRINIALSPGKAGFHRVNLFLPLFHSKTIEFPSCIEGLQPWMAFFNTWVQYLRQRGWDYSMDLDAFHIAGKLAKSVCFLESIQEQIEALEGIPVERIIAFFKDIKNWDRYIEQHIRFYLKGDLAGWPGATMGFPTRCASILDQRDPILFERMRGPLAEGNTAVFVGIPHVRAIRPLLLEDGFHVEQIER
jgi:hypothetical protein